MGLDESKMNRFSHVMQPGLNYREMRHIYLWSICILFLGVPIAWHPSPAADPTTWETFFPQGMTCCRCVRACPATRGWLCPGCNAELRREGQVAAAYELLSKTGSGPSGHARTHYPREAAAWQCHQSQSLHGLGLIQ